jgi:hypothetical protein
MNPGPGGRHYGRLSGIGAASAIEFGRIGTRMILTDRSIASAEDLVERVRAGGGQAFARWPMCATLLHSSKL